MAQPNYRRIARQDARKYGLDPNVFGRQIKQESDYNPHAVSPAGARGIAQIMPGTARGLGVNPDDPIAALNAAAKLMASYVQKYGSYKNALVAYNAGPGRVGGPLPAETQNYVKSILGGHNPKSSAPRGGGYQPPSVAPSTTAPTGPDPRTQIALSLLGLGNLTGGGYGGGDSLTNSLLAAAQAQQAPQPQAQPTSSRVPQQGNYGGGVTHFDGKPVAAWIAPILKQARATGLWKGNVTSGVRSKSEQLAAAKRFGLGHYGPRGPLASNHVAGHGGAVDVSDPQGLKRALAALHSSRLKSSMADDPVHFSRTGY